MEYQVTMPFKGVSADTGASIGGTGWSGPPS